EPCEDVKKRGLAAAGRADDRDKLTGGDVERHRGQCRYALARLGGEDLGEAADRYGLAGAAHTAPQLIFLWMPLNSESKATPRMPITAMPTSTLSARKISMPLAMR